MASATLLSLRLRRFLGNQEGKLDWPDAPLRLALHAPSDLQRLHSCKKEPETVEWLRSSLTEDSVFYDVGANVGAYSLVAASLGKGRAKIYGFEPSFSSFATFSENILLNGFEESIVPLHVALSGENGFLTLNFSSVESGAAKHTLGGKTIANAKTLLVSAMTLDVMRRELKLPDPTAIKIDVDGGEWGVLQGAQETLALPSLTTILIEIDTTELHGNEIELFLKNYGFSLSSRHARGKGVSSTLANCIFTKSR